MVFKLGIASQIGVRRLVRWPVTVLLVGVILPACVGCQTFNLSEGDFQQQQRGRMVDPETGDAVATAGTLGYYGAMIGALVEEVVRR